MDDLTQTTNPEPGQATAAVCPICRSRDVTTTVPLDTYPPYAVYTRIVFRKREPFPCCETCRVRHAIYQLVLLAAAAGLGAMLAIALFHLGAGSRLVRITKGALLVFAYLCALAGLSYALFGKYYFRARQWLMLNTTPTRILIAGPTPHVPGRLYKE